MARDAEPRGLTALDRALDEARFGAARTLNLRTLQPTASQATSHAEQWLRLMQVQGASEVLLITGRGNQSIDGWSPVREAIVRLLPSLRRRNVITGYMEHTAGSFVVTMAPMRALFEAPKRRRERTPGGGAPSVAPATLAALEPETLKQLRELAAVTMSSLGLHSPTQDMLDDEMRRQFGALSVVVPDGPDREATLQQAIQRALEEFEK